MDGVGSAAYNLGNGNGFSVREVIDTARKVTWLRDSGGLWRTAARRSRATGGRCAPARADLGWTPRYADLATTAAHAWQWETRAKS